MPATPRAAIIGGCLGGLASCLALHRRGIEAVVYEQTAELSEIGAGLKKTVLASEQDRPDVAADR